MDNKLEKFEKFSINERYHNNELVKRIQNIKNEIELVKSEGYEDELAILEELLFILEYLLDLTFGKKDK